jgi:putative spermidine/putrescine transport system ATP-binding protein
LAHGDGSAAISVLDVVKRFGEVTAVAGVSIDVRPGEFFSLLGPSGSGKTTILRMIAGFELPTCGSILLHGEDVTRRPPFERDVNTVFQDYALFPHMTVSQNVEYGLRVKRVSKADRRARATEALATVRLEGYGDRKPSQLSGGQRQRVALARALVNRPGVLLLDEPLGALDLKLREGMQIELKRIQREVGITFVFVTHDQGEALTMSDRIAVFNQGRVEQVGTPVEVYEHPATEFVAGFVGTSNVLPAATARVVLGSDAPVMIRPEKLRVAHPEQTVGVDEVGVNGAVSAEQYLGSGTRVRVDLDPGGDLLVDVPNQEAAAAPVGARVQVTFRRADAFRLPEAHRDPDATTDPTHEENPQHQPERGGT